MKKITEITGKNHYASSEASGAIIQLPRCARIVQVNCQEMAARKSTEAEQVVRVYCNARGAIEDYHSPSWLLFRTWT